MRVNPAPKPAKRKDLKCKVNPDTIGVKVRDIRRTRDGDVHMEAGSCRQQV